VITWIKRHYSIILQSTLFLLGIAGGVYASIAPANSLMRWYNIDDAFYYYKVAQNVLAGYGFTFDQINLANGFHPLWMVVCLGVFWLSQINLLLPLRVLVLVSALFNAFTGILLFRLISKVLHPRTAFIGALAWILLPPIYGTTIVHGMEAVVSAFFMVALLLATVNILNLPVDQPIKRTRFILVGIIAALTVLSRLDNVFFVFSVGLFLLFRIRKIKPALFYDLMAIVFSGFLAWVLRLGLNVFETGAYSVYPMLVVSCITKPVAYYFSGLYGTRQRLSPVQVITRTTYATSLAAITNLGLFVLMNKIGLIELFSKSVLLIDAIITWVLIVVLHLTIRESSQWVVISPLGRFKEWLDTSWKRILAEGSMFALPIAVILGAYVIYNKIAFGTFMPVSGQIKQWWNTLPNTIYAHKNTLLTVLGLSPSPGYGPWSLATSQFYDMGKFLSKLLKLEDYRADNYIFSGSLFFFVAITMVLLAARKGRMARKAFHLLIPAIVIGALLQIGYYNTVGYQHTRSWYWVAEMIAIVLLSTLLLEILFDWLKHGVFKRIVSLIITAGLVVYICILHVRFIDNLVPMKVPQSLQAEYLNETRQLQELTEEGSLIGMTGGGSVAYFLENRTIVNLDGLINSVEYFHALKEGSAREFLDDLPLDYVYGKEYVLLVSDPYNKVFEDRLDEIGVIRGAENFTLYKYIFNK